VILFELLAGRPPFLGESVPELCATMLRDEPPSMSLFRADVPPELERVILRCLAKDREQRYATVADIAQDLIEFAPLDRVHADRAIGVVRAANARLSLPGSTVGRGSTRLLATPAPSVPEPHAGSGSGSVPGVTSERSPTAPGWNKTGSSGGPRPRALVLGVAGVAVLALVVISILLTRGSGEPSDATKTESDVSAAARTENAPAVTPIVTPSPTVTSAADAESTSSAPAPGTSATAPKASRPRVWEPIAPATAAPPPPPPADTLPDFGGRR
jgi:serine/threonine-protein kinase